MEKKTLLVDDEPGILKVLGISLADRGYRVFTAESGEEALQIFKEELPAIVLTDIKMPGMDGIDLLRKIKEKSPDTEVIMITGHGDMELAIQSLKHAASDFITKPIDDDALDIALKRAAEKITVREKLDEYTENLEKLVEEKTKRLVETERLAAVGQTVAGLAHAIKNITAGLRGGMFVLEKGIQLDNKKYLSQGWGMVRGNVKKVQNMAADLLNYAKEREPAYQWCDPNLPAEEVYTLMLSPAEANGIALKADLGKDLPNAWFDPEAIHRALLNLVTNAIDACTDISCSSKSCEVVLRSSKPEGWAVEYQVTDNGCGMGEETKKRLFQTFFTTKGSMGTGLGLMIAKKIVDEHQGLMDVSSEEGEGSTFVIRLPQKGQP
ncbi:MAG: response regulator [Deltaproteobacteria bacterium]|jgi:signal transduction histidine kinase